LVNNRRMCMLRSGWLLTMWQPLAGDICYIEGSGRVHAIGGDGWCCHWRYSVVPDNTAAVAIHSSNGA